MEAAAPRPDDFAGGDYSGDFIKLAHCRQLNTLPPVLKKVPNRAHSQTRVFSEENFPFWIWARFKVD